jgi:hypothetical protein
MSQSQPLRIENPDLGSFATARTQNSKLWFANNKALENQTLGYLAKYQQKYNVTLYAKVFQGNHFHIAAKFPNCNRAQFYRDYNARVAQAVKRHVVAFPGGTLFERRYSEQALPLNEDIEDRFFYCALQPVHAGLCERIGDYPGYNSFDDAVSGRRRKYSFVNWAAFNEAKRNNQNSKIKDFTESYTLKFERLPGYEDLSHKEYKVLMYKKLEERRLKIVREWRKKGHQFLTKHQLRKIRAGTLPKTTKKSERYSKRPLVLTKCTEAKKLFLEWYFSVYHQYKNAVKKYLLGDVNAKFPPGTYKPPGPFVPLATV